MRFGRFGGRSAARRRRRESGSILLGADNFSVVVNGNRTTTATWDDPADAADPRDDGYDYYRQEYDQSGNPVGSEILVDSVSQGVETFDDPFSDGGGGGANEPAGMTTITDWNGDSQLFGDGWDSTGAPRMTNNTYNEVVADATTESGFALEHRYFSGEDGDTGNGLQTKTFPQYQSIYCYQRDKWSANWDNDANVGGMKNGYMLTDLNNSFFLGLGNQGTLPWPFYSEYLADGGGNVYAFGSPEIANVDEDVDQEWYVDLPTGTMKLWINDTLVINVTGADFSDISYINGFQWFPIRGTAGHTRTVNDSFRKKKFYLSGKAA